jgi:hypothetical protein
MGQSNKQALSNTYVKHASAKSYGASMFKDQGCSSPVAPSATLSPVLYPTLGGALFATVRTRILTSHQCFLLFREPLWFVCLTLSSSPSPYKAAPGNSRRCRFEISIEFCRGTTEHLILKQLSNRYLPASRQNP